MSFDLVDFDIISSTITRSFQTKTNISIIAHDSENEYKHAIYIGVTK